MRFFGALLTLAALVAVAGCGATPAATSATPTPAPTPDVVAARTAASTIIRPLPGTPGVWVACSQLAGGFAACPFAPVLSTRLEYLSSIGYFADAPPGVCGEDYITGTQNGLFVAPQVLSAVADANGRVAVVIQRGPPPLNLTATMTFENGLWLASDLASGTGPAASIFSAKPDC